MVFRQLLSLALVGVSRAEANCNGIQAPANVHADFNYLTMSTFRCRDVYTSHRDGHIVATYYFENQLDSQKRVQVYAQVPNMPSGDKSYGTFGLKLKDHSELYMWGWKNGTVVTQDWRIMHMTTDMKKRGRSPHTFTVKSEAGVTFKNAKGVRNSNGLLEIAFTLPSNNFNFTAIVGSYDRQRRPDVPLGTSPSATTTSPSATTTSTAAILIAMVTYILI
eukprot:GEMP01080956.1.p1 GENE.GEMP01080956.1~~GEMP01080956.1.p1  ORF type:complete len:249 (+),score=10.65 GEMP01080956.1:90-749(+)